LLANVILSDPRQRELLLTTCGVKVSAKQGTIVRDVNVFNSSHIRSTLAKDDPDLGAPNKGCTGGGPGIGRGGRPSSPYPNCAPQGNLLIIQDPTVNKSIANDSPLGGCFTFEFEHPIDLVNIGMLDLERPATIKVFKTNLGMAGPFISPTKVGDNGFWPMNRTNPNLSLDATSVNKIEICLAESGGISFLDYFGCIDNRTSAPSAPPPTPSPSEAPTSCPIINCDFENLYAGVGMNNATQAAKLLDHCLMTVTTHDTISNNIANIFNSSSIRSTNAKDDPDLGSPNKACPGGGPGLGNGGKPSAKFPNCFKHGNIMIIQNEGIDASMPNDSAFGGCLNYTFSQSVRLLNFGILVRTMPRGF
jgi:hypothetical protein